MGTALVGRNRDGGRRVDKQSLSSFSFVFFPRSPSVSPSVTCPPLHKLCKMRQSSLQTNTSRCFVNPSWCYPDVKVCFVISGRRFFPLHCCSNNMGFGLIRCHPGWGEDTENKLLSYDQKILIFFIFHLKLVLHKRSHTHFKGVFPSCTRRPIWYSW